VVFAELACFLLEYSCDEVDMAKLSAHGKMIGEQDNQRKPKMSSKALYLSSHTIPTDIAETLYVSVRKHIKNPREGYFDEYIDIIKPDQLRVLHLLTAGVPRLKEKARIIATQQFFKDYSIRWECFDIVVSVVLSGNGEVINGNYKKIGEVQPGSVVLRAANRSFGMKSNGDKPIICLELLLATTSSITKVNQQLEQNLTTLF